MSDIGLTVPCRPDPLCHHHHRGQGRRPPLRPSRVRRHCPAGSNRPGRSRRYRTQPGRSSVWLPSAPQTGPRLPGRSLRSAQTPGRVLCLLTRQLTSPAGAFQTDVQAIRTLPYRARDDVICMPYFWPLSEPQQSASCGRLTEKSGQKLPASAQRHLRARLRSTPLPDGCRPGLPPRQTSQHDLLTHATARDFPTRLHVPAQPGTDSPPTASSNISPNILLETVSTDLVDTQLRATDPGRGR
jgi:hypothetical protein